MSDEQPRGPGDPTRPLRYLVVGGWNTLFGWVAFATFYALFEKIGIHYLWATLPAHLAAITNAWLFQRRFVFGSASPALRSYGRFSLVYWLLYAVNLPALAALVYLGLHPLLAQGLLIGASAALGYVAHLRFTFRPSTLERL